MRAASCLLLALPAVVWAQPPAVPPPLPSVASEARAGESEVRALLDAGHVDEAATATAAWLARAPDSPTAHAFMAITRLCSAARHIATDLAARGARARYSDEKYWRDLLTVLDGELARADADLQAACVPRFSLVLCPGCWRIDWDGDGSVDEPVLAVEHDGNDKVLPAGDARRHPTFAFDVGDVHWARAAVSFVRAMVSIGLAYRFPDLFAKVQRFELDELPLKLEDASRIEKARAYILQGLEHSERARAAYLAERDDDREWIPNPRQHSHPVPLTVDETMYQRWLEALRAVGSLVRGDTAIDLAALARLSRPLPKVFPHGFLDVGALFSRPRDFVFRMGELQRRDRPDEALRHLFGDAFVPHARANALPALIERSFDELRRAKRPVDRDFRYIFWLN